jgi:outer membrane biosynthesis protein TonB
MAIRDWWDKWVYAVAAPAWVENREHTAEEVRNVVEDASLTGTSRGLGVGVCTGLVVGACLPLALWFLLHQPASASRPNVNDSELRQLRAENEKLRNLSSAPGPSVDEDELKQLRAENERFRAENEKLKSQQPVAEKPKEEAKPGVTEKPKEEEKAVAAELPKEVMKPKMTEKPKEAAKLVVARPPKTKKREEPKGTLQRTAPPNTYVCGDGRTVTNPAQCRPTAEPSNTAPNTYLCGDGRTVMNPAQCRAKGG